VNSEREAGGEMGVVFEAGAMVTLQHCFLPCRSLMVQGLAESSSILRRAFVGVDSQATYVPGWRTKDT
jgi:hypothetical protein